MANLLTGLGRLLNRLLAKLRIRMIRSSSFRQLTQTLSDTEIKLSGAEERLQQTQQALQQTQQALQQAPATFGRSASDGEDVVRWLIAALPHALDGKADLSAQNAAINEDILQRYLFVLTDRHFRSLPFDMQQATLERIFLQLISTGNRNAHLVGKAMAKLFGEYLADDDIDVYALMKVYDYLYGLYWVGASELASMSQFDRDVVIKFSDYLRRRHRQPPGRIFRENLPDRKLRVCYFCHYAHFDRGNAVGPHVLSLARAHSVFNDSEYDVYLYCVQWYKEAFLQALQDTRVTVRTFGTGTNIREVESIRQAAARDEIDVVITDIASGVATYLFELRVAPIQMWIEFGFPYWSIANLDWAFLSHKRYRGDFGVDPRRCSPLRLRQQATTMVKQADEGAVAEARSEFPEGAELFGVFGRFAKITDDLLFLVERILMERADAHIVIAGTGDPTHIERFLERRPIRERVLLHQEYVDINVWGRVIDAYLDTFPFCGGNACREVMMFGKPVVSMYSRDWPGLSTESRDAELVVHTHDDYVKKALRLMRDEAFYESRSAFARELASEETVVKETVEEITRVIRQLVPGGISQAVRT